MTDFTSGELSAAQALLDDPLRVPPADAVGKFEAIVTSVMSATGRDRTWARQRAAEHWSAEYDAAVAAA